MRTVRSRTWCLGRCTTGPVTALAAQNVKIEASSVGQEKEILQGEKHMQEIEDVPITMGYGDKERPTTVSRLSEREAIIGHLKGKKIDGAARAVAY